MMIKDLEVARELSHEEQAAVHGGTGPSLAQLAQGVNVNGDATLVAEQFGIGNVAVLVDAPVQLNLGVNVGQNIAPAVNVSPKIETNGGIFF